MDSRQRYWLHKFYEGRHQKEFQILMKDLFIKWFHVAPAKLKEHLRDIEPAFIKPSRFCRPISANKRFNVKLRYLLTQDSYGIADMNCIIILTAIGRVIKEIIKCSIQHIDFNRVS